MPKKQSRIVGSQRFLNRELGLLAFNKRVLTQAADERTPLLERLRFLCIVSSNLDEFFEIRVAGLKERIRLGDITRADAPGARTIYRQVARDAHALVNAQYRLLNNSILPELGRHRIWFLGEDEWNRDQRAWLSGYFAREMMPLLTPIGLDPGHPFPRVLNKSLNFAVQLKGRDAFGRTSGTAVVQAPRLLPRVIRLPAGRRADGHQFVLLSAVLQAFVGKLFRGMRVRGCFPFRVTRNSDLFLDEEEIKNLREALQGELPQRHFGDAVRLEMAADSPPGLEAFLMEQFELVPEDIYRVNGVVNLVRLMQLPDLVDAPELKFPVFSPGLPAEVRTGRIFQDIARNDILLHHPFQAFAPVLEFLEQAAADPDVVAIKQTVYRTSTDSALMKHVIDAAQKGKEVTVVVELLARFDEEINLNWSARLEEAGAHVVYGIIGHKTHAKMLMVVRREKGRLRRYVHISTGNYHPSTARLYTDFGLMTANEEICEDINETFKQLTGLGRARRLKRIWLSPISLHANLLDAIRREKRMARSGRKAHIIAKMNSLLEQGVIEALYDASRAGVKIDLIVRGVCALRPGIPGLSENISVRSIIGRFLEHHRIFYFFNGGREDVYLSSADWMERNFFRRIELCVPVLDGAAKTRIIKEGLRTYLRDNVQSWRMDKDGAYRRRTGRGSACAQKELLKLLSSASLD